jgi:hypothetical protein
MLHRVFRVSRSGRSLYKLQNTSHPHVTRIMPSVSNATEIMWPLQQNASSVMMVLRQHVPFWASFPELIELTLSGEFKRGIRKFKVVCRFLHNARKDPLWKSGARISLWSVSLPFLLMSWKKSRKLNSKKPIPVLSRSLQRIREKEEGNFELIWFLATETYSLVKNMMISDAKSDSRGIF